MPNSIPDPWHLPSSSSFPLANKDWRRQWHPTPVLLPGKSHGRRSLVGCSPWSRWGSDTTERLPFHFSLSCIGEGNGNPLQCSCLENPRDGGAWWAAVYGVAQSRTWLKWLSSNKDWEKETTNLNFLTFLRLTPWSHLNSNIKQKAVKLIKELEKDTRQFCCFPIEKWFSNENLFYSSGNPTQCFVVTQMGRKSTKEGIYVYV